MLCIKSIFLIIFFSVVEYCTTRADPFLDGFASEGILNKQNNIQ